MKETEEQNDVRIKDMAEVIRSYQASGLTITEWCSQNSISEGSYYFWLKNIEYHGCKIELSTGTEYNDIATILKAVKTIC